MKNYAVYKPLTEIKPNAANPRSITDENLQLLVNSILEFPKMLDVRPIVTDSHGVILGGNMRYKALCALAAMDEDAIIARLTALRGVQRLTSTEVEQLVVFWQKWLKSPYSAVVCVDDLSEADRAAFVIKDNVNFGGWDYDALQNFDKEDLNDWGIRSWEGIKPFDTSIASGHSGSATPGEPASEEVDGDADLPTPQVIKDERQRIIIIYPESQADRLAAMLGLPELSKSAYRYDELTAATADTEAEDTPSTEGE